MLLRGKADRVTPAELPVVPDWPGAEGAQARDLTISLTRVARGDGSGPDASLIRALADDLELGFDPLAADLAARFRAELLGLASPRALRQES